MNNNLDVYDPDAAWCRSDGRQAEPGKGYCIHIVDGENVYGRAGRGSDSLFRGSVDHLVAVTSSSARYECPLNTARVQTTANSSFSLLYRDVIGAVFEEPTFWMSAPRLPNMWGQESLVSETRWDHGT